MITSHSNLLLVLFEDLWTLCDLPYDSVHPAVIKTIYWRFFFPFPFFFFCIPRRNNFAETILSESSQASLIFMHRYTFRWSDCGLHCANYVGFDVRFRYYELPYAKLCERFRRLAFWGSSCLLTCILYVAICFGCVSIKELFCRLIYPYSSQVGLRFDLWSKCSHPLQPNKGFWMLLNLFS